MEGIFMVKGVVNHPQKDLKDSLLQFEKVCSAENLIKIFQLSFKYGLKPTGLKSQLNKCNFNESDIDEIFEYFLGNYHLFSTCYMHLEENESLKGENLKDNVGNYKLLKDQTSPVAKWLWGVGSDSMYVDDFLYINLEEIYKSPWSFFWYLYPYYEDIKAIFEDENPIDIIGEYLRGFFPNPHDDVVQDKQKLKPKAYEAFKYNRECLEKIKNRCFAGSSIQFVVVDLVISEIWCESFTKFVALISTLKVDLLNSVLRVVTDHIHFLDTGENGEYEAVFEDLENSMLSYFTLPLIRGNYFTPYRDVVLSEWCKYTSCESENDLWQEVQQKFTHQIEGFSATNELDTIINLFEFMDRVAWIGGDCLGAEIDWEYKESEISALHHISSYISYLRAHDLGLALPISLRRASDFHRLFVGICSENDKEEEYENLKKLDLTILLAAVAESNISLYLFKERDVTICYFMALISKALDEDLYLFANALMTFLMFYIASEEATSDDFNFNTLSSLLVRCKDKPGHMITAKMMKHVLNQNESGGQENRLFIRGLADIFYGVYKDKSPVIDLHTRSLDKKEIEKYFIGHLTISNWQQLAGYSQKTLIEAETTWRILAQHMGDKKENLGTLLIDYILPIEFELTERLRKIFFNEAYFGFLDDNDIKRPNKDLTLGPILVLIDVYSKIKPEKKTVLYEFGDLLDKLGPLLKDLNDFVLMRNDGAHPRKRGISPPEFISFRARLFNDGFLKRFVECIKDY
jgi:hypothetical protein